MRVRLRVWIGCLGAAVPAQASSQDGNAGSLLEQARTCWELGDAAALRAVAQRAVARWPRAPWALLALGQAHAAEAREASGRDTATAALAAFVATLDAAWSQTDLLTAGPLDDVATLVRLPAHATLAQLRQAVATQVALLGAGTAPALDAARRALAATDPQLAPLQLELADARRLRQRARLIAAAHQLLRLRPADPLACLALGEAHGSAGAGCSPTRAQQALDRFLQRTAADTPDAPTAGLAAYLQERSATLAAIRGRVTAWRAELAAGRRLFTLSTRAELEPVLAANATHTRHAQQRLDSLRKDLAWWRASRRSDAGSTMHEIQRAIADWQRTLTGLQAEARILQPQLEQARRAENDARR